MRVEQREFYRFTQQGYDFNFRSEQECFCRRHGPRQKAASQTTQAPEPGDRHPIIPFEARVVFGAEKAGCVFLSIHSGRFGMASCTPLSFARSSKMTRAFRWLRRALSRFGAWSLYPRVRPPNGRRICARPSLVSWRATGSVPRPPSRPWVYRRLWFRGECFRLRFDQTFAEGRHRYGYEDCATFTLALIPLSTRNQPKPPSRSMRPRPPERGRKRLQCLRHETGLPRDSPEIRAPGGLRARGTKKGRRPGQESHPFSFSELESGGAVTAWTSPARFHSVRRGLAVTA